MYSMWEVPTPRSNTFTLIAANLEEKDNLIAFHYTTAWQIKKQYTQNYIQAMMARLVWEGGERKNRGWRSWGWGRCSIATKDAGFRVTEETGLEGQFISESNVHNFHLAGMLRPSRLFWCIFLAILASSANNSSRKTFLGGAQNTHTCAKIRKQMK